MYTPQLTVTFKASADRGGYISLEGLEQAQSREIKDVIEVSHPEVENQRILSYVATTLATVGLATSMLIHYRVKRHEKKELVDVKLSRVMREHRDVMVEALTSSPEVHVTIEVRSLEDLVKVAEILAKPILKAIEDEKQVFYVVDGSIKYQCKV